MYSYPAVARYTMSGTPDSRFGNNGIAYFETDNEGYTQEYADSIAVDSEGRILLGAGIHLPDAPNNYNFQSGLMRFKGGDDPTYPAFLPSASSQK